ncbi:MAG TPA: GNAT family N-acetyltransferase [Candidatus Eisenbacteria bacterium]|jgi:GNAT superfamily N-acetyltransferase
MTLPGSDAAKGRATIETRPVRPADLERVWEMIRGLAEYEKLTDILTGSREGLEALLFDRPAALLGQVAERADGRLVGYALYHFTYSSFRTNARMWLEDLYVEESARGTGAGEKLLAAFVREALAHGCHRVDWHVLEWNPARAFYERMGAARSDDGMLQYGLDAAGMRRLLERA